MISKIFEEISIDIWKLIRDSSLCGIRQGEETITDSILLELFRKQTPNIRIVQTPKIEERDQGTDWEWWIGSSKHGWLRYAVQAKRLKPGNNYYGSLNHFVGKQRPKPRQLDILKRYSEKNKAIPLYCFYNYVNMDNLLGYWNCMFKYDKLQLGWTFTPLEVVEDAIRKKNRNFEFIHAQKKTLPMRCLVKCPAVLSMYRSVKGMVPVNTEDFEYLRQGYYTTLPTDFEGYLNKVNTISEMEIHEFPSNFYDPEINLYPRRIGIINNNEEIEAVSQDNRYYGN